MRAILGWISVALLLALAPEALAQGAIIQTGPVVPYHAPTWTGNGTQGDGGTPSAPAVSTLGLFNGSNCPFGISSQAGPGISTTAYSVLTICQTAATTTFQILGVNGQPTPNVLFNIGGINYPFPGSGSGNVVGPNSSTVSDAACFNNTAGTLLKDCGALGSFAGQNYATPPAIGGTTPNTGAFTTLAASGTVSGAGFTALFASPPAIGGTAPAAGAFTTLSATSTVSGAGITSLFASPPAIGGGTPAGGAFTTLSASSTVSGAGFTSYLASPAPIGSSSPNTGAFTTLAASSTVSGTGFSNYLASPPAIGGTTAAAGTFTTLTANSTVTLSPASHNVVLSPTGTGLVTINPATLGTLDNVTIGGTTPAAISATTLTANNTVTLSPPSHNVVLSPTGTGFVTINPATLGTMDNVTVGGTTPAAGTFTNATANNVRLAASQAAGGDGIYNATTHAVNVSVNGSSVAQFTSTGLNNAAIGATTPSTVAGTTVSASTAANIQGANAALQIHGVALAEDVTPTCSASDGSPGCVVSHNNGSAIITMTLSSCGSCTTITITPGYTAANAFYCRADDATTSTERLFQNTALSNTTSTLTFFNAAGTATPPGATDVIIAACGAD